MPSFRGSASARPSKGMSWLAAIVGIGMVVTVLLFFVSPMYAGIAFVALWVVTLFGIIGYHIKNATSDDGVPHSRLNFSAESGGADQHSQSDGDFDERLRDLEQLRKDELISDAEYERKRSEILSEDW